ncbi:magnesium transporter [Roseovarius autotrophicus]|uniref:magnesium transporter n=1 Tax=Roseovarius autotrophicus TaxID=2824121 RepID=UPI0019EC267B|nr:magnesium transporter [Roseovarius autotrophicus]MBE0454019.1 magnesium transporter [Roseovarius sp.]
MAEKDDDLVPDAGAEEQTDKPLGRARMSRIMYALDTENRELLWSEMEPLHPADIADLLEQINAYDRRRLITLYGQEFDGDILSELDESIREEVIGLLTPEVLAEAVRELDSDDVVDLVEDLEDEQQAAILKILEDSDRVAVQQSLTYPEYSAGRLMQREVVMTPEHWTVGDAIDFMRNAEELPEQFYHVILVDPRLHPVGNITLGKMMAARRSTPLRDLVEETFHVFKVTDEEADVAYAFNQYHLISAPVVDGDGRLVGVITIDDAMIVLDEEHEEDYLKLAGVGDTSLTDKVWTTARGRFPWLLINLITANVAAQVIAQFEATIQQIVLLAILMPIVASMGGNAGTQSLAVAVRALATKDLTASNAVRVLTREAGVGTLNGLAFGVIMGGVVALWFGEPVIGMVIAAALLLTLIGAAVGGVLIPLVLERMGVDPAVASGPFVTTITDIVGFFVFLGIATMVLI